jgi:hypothetical protein
MLRINHLIQRGMHIRIGPTPDIRLPLQQCHLRPSPRQRNRRRQSSHTRPDNQHLSALTHEVLLRAIAALTNPCPRMASFTGAGTETRS